MRVARHARGMRLIWDCATIREVCSTLCGCGTRIARVSSVSLRASGSMLKITVRARLLEVPFLISIAIARRYCGHHGDALTSFFEAYFALA